MHRLSITCLRRGAAAFLVAAAVLTKGRAPVFAQGGLPPPLNVAGITMSGSFRMRLESWEWFGHSPSGTYTYPGSLFRAALEQTR